MEKIFQEGGSKHITALIEKSIEDGSRTATVSGNWLIEYAVALPSNFTLILDNCHLKMTDCVYSNMFINEHLETEIGRTAAGRDRNIAILGRGEAILDGGTYNGLSESNSGQNGMPCIWKNCLVLFANVEDFKIENIACHNQRWWALTFVFCAYGTLRSIDFRSSDIGVDKDGNVYHGLRRKYYGDVLVKNADGIDLRQGCHHITIEDITGFTEDDTIALTGLYGNIEGTFGVEELPSDIAYVTIKNVAAASYCTIVRMLNQSGVKLHDIEIDGVTDTSAKCPYLDMGIFGVRIGDTHLYGTRHATADETYNISVKNVKGCRGAAAVALAGRVSGLTLENIQCEGQTGELMDQREKD